MYNDLPFNIFMTFIIVTILLFMCSIALSTTDRICDGTTAIYKTKVLGYDIKQSIKQKDTWCD